MTLGSSLVAVTFAAVLSAAAAPASAQTLGRSLGGANAITVAVVSTGAAAAFSGTFTLQRFVATADGLEAVGLLTGVATPAGGTPTSIVQTVMVPAQAQMLTSAPGDVGTQQIDPGACGILHLDLGPLFLDLLGLQVDLSQVILDIAAAPGAGNLLGNLLCAVTGLLDSPGGLARLLNQILGILG
jgi:hypothetical protein